MIGLPEIEDARRRIAAAIYQSPCARSEGFSRRFGAATFFKLENLQRTGSFKERGALNKLLTLSETERTRGVITASAGNHAQALAYHCGVLGIPATVVMPERSPLVKVTNTRSYGARVFLHGENFDAALDRARAIEAEEGLVFVHAFADELVIAGQGTTGLELMEQVPDLEVVIVPIGGGGLISGIAAAYRGAGRKVRIVGVTAAAIPAMKESVEAGRCVTLPPARTIADGIAIKRPSELTLAYVERYVDDIVSVDDEEIANAILLLLEREKTVAEGAAATALAALYNDHVPAARGKRSVMILSGGNIDVNLLSRIIERGLAKDGRQIQIGVNIEDRPGALAELLNRVGEAGANVLQVRHERAFGRAGWDEVDVELILETRGYEHVEELLAALAQAGFAAQIARSL